MLHEILISLSGYPSDVWEKAEQDEALNTGLHTYVTAPERAMLQVLARLSSLHIRTREKAATISTSQGSIICRAVASAITNRQLADFQKKVLDVESSILRRDAGYVGAYEIVPLSTIVSEFSPWTRRLEWLYTVTEYIDGEDMPSKSGAQCTGKALLDYLQSAILTGYSDIESMATHLLVVGQKVWVRSLASWIFYGMLPSYGSEDFMIQQQSQPGSSSLGYRLESLHIPKFVAESTAESILSIGIALHQIKSRLQTISADQSHNINTTILLRSTSLKLLESLSYPVNVSILDDAITSINSSVSQIALSQLLPLTQVLDILEVIRKYMLLESGEFSMSLIRHADERVKTHVQTQNSSQPVRKVGRLDNLLMKDAELGSILAKVWAELASLQWDEGSDDKIFVLARKLVRFNVSNSKIGKKDTPLVSTVLPIPSFLNFSFPPDSVLPIFIGPSDVSMYSRISSLLLSLRRAEIHISDLWKMTPQRRCHPTPIGPPSSSRPDGRRALSTRRSRDATRNIAMRKHWSTCSRLHFCVSELSGYYHVEVIQNSWIDFTKWLNGNQRTFSSSSTTSSRPVTRATDQLKSSHVVDENRFTSSQTEVTTQNDPRKLAVGHQSFLQVLHGALLLDSILYLSRLNDLLLSVDHYTALFSQLQAVWDGLDLQEDDGVLDAFSNYVQEEQEVLGEMDRTRNVLESQLLDLTETIKEEERRMMLDEVGNTLSQLDLNGQRYVPWKARTLDRLIMKLDCLSGRQDQDEDDGEMIEDYEDK